MKRPCGRSCWSLRYTPTFDPINQSLVAVPIIVLYEVGIWLAKLGRLGRRQGSLELDSKRR